jgi:predicted DNA-binding protein
LKTRLVRLSERTGRSRTSYGFEALNEHIGDLEALSIAEQRIIKHRAERNRFYTQKEIEERYGLAD